LVAVVDGYHTKGQVRHLNRSVGSLKW